MFFALPVLLYTLIFLAGLELAIFFNQIIFYFAIISIIISLWGSKKIGKNWTNTIIPVLLSISSFLLLYLIDSTIEKQIFVFLSILLYYIAVLGIFRISEYNKDQTARGMIAAGAVTALFFFYSAVQF